MRSTLEESCGPGRRADDDVDRFRFFGETDNPQKGIVGIAPAHVECTQAGRIAPEIVLENRRVGHEQVGVECTARDSVRRERHAAD